MNRRGHRQAHPLMQQDTELAPALQQTGLLWQCNDSAPWQQLCACNGCCDSSNGGLPGLTAGTLII